MARFKKGQTVYRGRGNHLRELVVAKVHKNPLLPIHQYTFEPPHDGFACGEQSLRATADGPDLKLRDCFVDDEHETETWINTLMHAGRETFRAEEHGVTKIFEDCDLRFRPSYQFCEWLRDYADGRMIIHVGSGQGHLVNMLNMVKAKVMGLEPNYNVMEAIKFRMNRGQSPNINEVLPWDVVRAKGLIQKMSENAMLVFARPRHDDLVEEGIDLMPEGMEALYINTPDNLEYLGKHADCMVRVEHKGQTEDDEIVYSIFG